MVTNDVNTTYKQELAIVYQAIDNNILNKLYILCMENKSTQIIKEDKNMTTITNKLEKVYTNL